MRIRSLAPLAALGLLVCAGAPAPRFDGERAYRDLVDLVRIGPRPAGSEGAARARELISERLRQAGWRVEEHRLAADTGAERIDMVNLIGVLPGERDELLLVGTHYDTKRLPGFVGANDGASGAAVLLELARALGDTPRPYTLWLVFFDGEEALGPSITPNDGLFGSRALAAEMTRNGDLDRTRALLLVDMVGDRHLHLTEDLSSHPALRQALAEVAERLGLEETIRGGGSTPVIDDHTPFQEAGLSQTLALIDFQFGGDSIPGTLWHTRGDNLAAVGADSLNRVGRLLVELLRRIERSAPLPRDVRSEPGSADREPGDQPRAGAR